MARKVFVSYKHADSLVYPIGLRGTCRDYVDAIMAKLEDVEIYKGEDGDNDLSAFKDTTIRTHLKEKIRDSSVTAVLITKGMKESRRELDQWIPWEVKYSLRRKAYGERRSNSNGMLAVIIPDEAGRYDHYYQPTNCVHCNTVTHKTSQLFEIISKNMFNKKAPSIAICPSSNHSTSIHLGNDYSYIHPVKWDDFIRNPSYYIDVAIQLRDNIHNYNIQKRVKA